ncbi:MAG: thioredoxin domain-containing protein [Anaerolineae bacterium]|nr:thioredoxin domain-containing protein [Anaerolineae bacterium]
MNRLQHETSPYLRQHADNPVDWYPWGEEAFRAAAEADKPILLSIGYSACHWCHVMAHESFENPATAALMNDLCINIKVDREERPDVDGIYMQAVQAMNDGHGGWPLTVFLTPEGKPFYGGTYFPKEPRYGMPSFRQILEGVAEAYRSRREEAEQVGGNLQRALNRELLPFQREDEVLNTELLDGAFKRMAENFDWRSGGFGGAPKFPQPMNLEFLLRAHRRTGDESALEMVKLTLTRMARGGIYDQVGGGFARYSTDALWLVPHFEKMLYDNAQLSRLYLHAWQVTGEPFFRRIAEEVYDYILREMTAPSGGFTSATDADSEGVEGKYFVWDKAELESLLGEDAALAIAYWDVTEHGNFEGRNILFVPQKDSVTADKFGLTKDALQEKIGAIRARLYAARAERVPPGLDDKLLAEWNGLMLAALAEGARVLGRDDYRAAAVRAADFLLAELVTPDWRVLRTHKDGTSKLNGYLADYAALAEGLLELYQTTFEPRYFEAAQKLVDVALVRFAAADGGYFDTSDDHERLLVRPRTFQDNASPSGTAVLAKIALRLSAFTGDPRYEEAARGALALLSGAMLEVPLAFGASLNAVDMAVSGLAEVAVVGDPAATETRALLDAIQRPYRPNIITALAPTDAGEDAAIPLLRQRVMRNGQPTVYVCRNFTCANPVTTPEEAAALLDTGA